MLKNNRLTKFFKTHRKHSIHMKAQTVDSPAPTPKLTKRIKRIPSANFTNKGNRKYSKENVKEILEYHEQHECKAETMRRFSIGFRTLTKMISGVYFEQ